MSHIISLKSTVFSVVELRVTCDITSKNRNVKTHMSGTSSGTNTHRANTFLKLKYFITLQDAFKIDCND